MSQWNNLDLFPIWSRVLAFLPIDCQMKMERTCKKMQRYVLSAYQMRRRFDVCEIINQKRDFDQDRLADLTARCRLLMQWISKKAKNIHNIGDLNAAQLWSIDYRSRDIVLLCETISGDLLSLLYQLENLRSIAYPKGFISSGTFLSNFHQLSPRLQQIDLMGLGYDELDSSQISNFTSAFSALQHIECLHLDESLSYLLQQVSCPWLLRVLSVCIEDNEVLMFLKLKCINLEELSVVDMNIKPDHLIDILRSCKRITNVGFQTDLTDYGAFSLGSREFACILTLKFGASCAYNPPNFSSADLQSLQPIIKAFPNISELQLINKTKRVMHFFEIQLPLTLMVDLTTLAGLTHLRKLRLNNFWCLYDWEEPVKAIQLSSSLTEIDFEISTSLFDATFYPSYIANILRGISLIDYQKRQLKKITIKNVPLLWSYSINCADGTKKVFLHTVFAAISYCFTQLDELIFESSFDWPMPCFKMQAEKELISMYVTLKMKCVWLSPNCYQAMKPIFDEHGLNVRSILHRSVTGFFDRRGCYDRRKCKPPTNRLLTFEEFATQEQNNIICDTVADVVECSDCKAHG